MWGPSVQGTGLAGSLGEQGVFRGGQGHQGAPHQSLCHLRPAWSWCLLGPCGAYTFGSCLSGHDSSHPLPWSCWPGRIAARCLLHVLADLRPKTPHKGRGRQCWGGGWRPTRRRRAAE